MGKFAARTKGLELLDAAEEVLWRRDVLERKEAVPQWTRRSRRTGCGRRRATQEHEVNLIVEIYYDSKGPEGIVEGIRASSDSTYSPLSLQARMQGAEQELQRFSLEREYGDDTSAGEDDLSWSSCHQFTYPTLA